MWCGVVWISSEHRSYCPERVKRIHPFDGASLKERKHEGNATNLHQVSSARCFVIGGKEFSKISKCEHVFIESEELCVKI